MVVFTDGWVVLAGVWHKTLGRVRTGMKGSETVAVCEASLEADAYVVTKEQGSIRFVRGFEVSFTVPWAVLCEPMPRHSIIAALKRQPEWKAWEKKRLQGKV